MNNETILYFCNSYLLMLDYYETLDEVISDFYGKELEKNVKKLKNECRIIFELNDKEKMMEIKDIISKAKYLDIKEAEMEDILKTIISKI